MVDALGCFIGLFLAFALLCGGILGLALIGIVDGLEWLMKKLGFSGPGYKVRPSKEQSVASVFEPFISNPGAINLKGKFTVSRRDMECI
jgi:hypothetical protein